MIWRNLWRRKTRTILTVLGVAVGVAAVVALSAFGEGFASGFEKMLSSTGADLTVSDKDAMISFLSVLDETVGDDLRQVPGVDGVCGNLMSLVQMPESPYFTVFGEDPRCFSIEHFRVTQGQPLNAKRQILIGRLTADAFDKQVGDSFKLNGTTFKVVGIFETGVNMEDGGAVISLDDAQRAFDRRNKVNAFSLRVSDVRRIDAVKEEIQSRWPELSASRSGDATVQSEAVGMYRSMGWFLGMFAVIVGGLGMMNTTLMSVIERTREIGVLRALGWRRSRVIRLILGEALTVGLIGGLLGLLLGVALTGMASLSPSVSSMLQGVYTPGILLQALVIALLLAAVGGFYPAWRASRLEPVEAMRSEGGASITPNRLSGYLLRRLGRGPLRNLLRRPTRTLVTSLGVAVGVGFIVSLLAITASFTVGFTQMASAGQSDLVAEQANVSDMSLSAIDDRVADRIRTHPEVREVSRMLIGVATAPGQEFLFLVGIDPREGYIRHYRVREGRLIERPNEIMLGRTLADGIDKPLGETLHIGGTSYRVVGIYENGVSYEDSGAVVLLKEAQAILDRRHESSLLSIGLHDPARATVIAQALEAAYPEVIVSQAADLTDRMQDFATVDAVVNALVLLTVIVGGIVMTNAMLMSVFERTQEVGLLRALGWRRRGVLVMVLTESLVLGGLSCVFGILFGMLLNYLFTLTPMMGDYLAPVYTPKVFLQVLILALGLGALGGMYPAWRAANLQPIEALRYE
jgi:ABC-type antimicrobial peptide transport system permease subunit